MKVSEFFAFVGILTNLQLAAWVTLAVSFVIGFFGAKLASKIFGHPLLVGLGVMFAIAFSWKALGESVALPNMGNITGLAMTLGALCALGIRAYEKLNRER